MDDLMGSSNKQVEFTRKQVSFLLENGICQIATSHNDIPHIVPVNYIYEPWPFQSYFLPSLDVLYLHSGLSLQCCHSLVLRILMLDSR